MKSSDSQICPWCQTEIVWDPEIGPEEECPHCQNQLTGYRSINLKVKQTGRELLFDEEVDDIEDDEEMDDRISSEDDMYVYEENVQRVMDEQEETPECPSCHEFLLFAGVRQVTAAEFAPAVPGAIGKPLLPVPHKLRTYVCPSCFKVESILSEEDRTKLIELLRQQL